ncbi:MAG TPA: hypothetical protein VHA78_01110 [Candidatus Peribacteraceae bacterium]|nr:hypothetical protein [Candidatus Peribacteraceae bacterium]
MKSPLAILAIVIGLLFIALGVYYFMTPAGSLPSYLPGFESGSTHVHLKHGIAAVVLGLACFIFAWFKSAPKVR